MEWQRRMRARLDARYIQQLFRPSGMGPSPVIDPALIEARRELVRFHRLSTKSPHSLEAETAKSKLIRLLKGII